MLSYEQVVEKLKALKAMGFIPSERGGDTGIGKTLEEREGIKENNIQGPDAEQIELKSARRGSSSMVTLITKAPLPKGSNSVIRERFGYMVNGQKEFHITIKAGEFVNIKGRQLLKAEVRNDKIEVVSIDGETVCYWNMDTLNEAFTKKLPSLIFVKADSRGPRNSEEFWFNEAWYLKGFSFSRFKGAVIENKIRVDFRIGHFPNGKVHDHGTGFRIFEDNFDLCFENRTRII